ncbi:asparagine synthase-related protein [Streptomyces ipomoeae]|uniref:asparagine synthase (glutamine-hydrolyzing) n=1 Tax=Streptomyces ipomoeae 91-03 TaxID=698759 RepID=L1L5C1_9ACTN|nr:asparagine synthase-related protein [Streptomyces ipomoeae]EKX67788.1 asparagine synthase [Streptomyces ipomoeae 91-03]MDX2692322.1 asparagine synthase-related protein [Streptomyces ipomoeae]MDX2819974.1 asparagine synthase-related protein [Streptomyces ipomoeae]MDX2837848.1 asparagine synthase-related protein [Streptomyces ipomoeae]MDX2872493.1 asparagine synthase-related protein [Streptomyces ipomoeae]
MTDHGEGWFTLFPDCEAALAVASRMVTRAARTIAHPSGNPFILGDWLTSVQARNGHGLFVALIGHTPVGQRELEAHIADVRDIDALDRLTARLPGDFHAVVEAHGEIHARGTAGGLRRLFHATVGEVTVSANRADTLARLLDAPLDEDMLALRLLDFVPHPLGDVPLWRGVRAVVPGDLLRFGRGRTGTVRWWEPPHTHVPLVEGAEALREALDDAVRFRVAAAETVSCDLSGGLDSTTICALAARASAEPLPALTMPSRDIGDDDVHWARLAASEIDSLEHILLGIDEIPLFYSGLLDVTGPVDEPLPTIIDQPRQLVGHDGLLARGSRLHFTGMGGDHVLWGHPAHHRDLLTTRPLKALRSIRGYRAQNRWSLRETVSVLTDRRPYGQWLADTADRITAPRSAPHSPDVFSWDIPPRLPTWVTPDAADSVRRKLREAAATAEPRGATHALHNELHTLHHGTRATRVLHQVAEHSGLPLASPFLDDRVITACWSVRSEERTTPWEFKPLLKTAMRGHVPDALLRRTTKGEASVDAANGLRENRVRLAELWRESHLAKAGLVDAERLVDITLRPSSPELRHGGLDATLACEIWLRTI